MWGVNDGPTHQLNRGVRHPRPDSRWKGVNDLLKPDPRLVVSNSVIRFGAFLVNAKYRFREESRVFDAKLFGPWVMIEYNS